MEVGNYLLKFPYLISSKLFLLQIIQREYTYGMKIHTEHKKRSK